MQHPRQPHQPRRPRNATGSGYVARHGPDFLLANDPWFRGLALKYGPDGGVYVTDWSDTGECHETDADNAHRENGRIYKITYGDAQAGEGRPGAASSDEELARLQLHKNDWYVRTARRLLQERAAAGRDLGAAHRVLREILAADRDPRHRLRALWALHATGGLDEKARLALLDDPSPPVRAWAVRLLVDDGPPSAEVIDRLTAMAGDGPKAEGEPAGAAVPGLGDAAHSRRRAAGRSPRRWPSTPSTGHHAESHAPDLVRPGAAGARAERPRPRCWPDARTSPSAGSSPGGWSPRTPTAGSRRSWRPWSMPGRESYPSFHREVLDGILEAVRGRKRVADARRAGRVLRAAGRTGRLRGPATGRRAGARSSATTRRPSRVLRTIVEDRTAAPGTRHFALRNLVELARPDGWRT